jgi:acyl carrier protein
LELEKAFGLSIPASEAVNLNSAQKILDYLDSKGVPK